MPTTLFEELRELIGDVHQDFAATLAEGDPDVYGLMYGLVIEAMTSDRPDDAKVGDIATTMMWWFLLGREHQQRGFPAPLPRRDEGVDETGIDSVIADILNDER
jgi:hypothetical protein